MCLHFLLLLFWSLQGQLQVTQFFFPFLYCLPKKEKPSLVTQNQNYQPFKDFLLFKMLSVTNSLLISVWVDNIRTVSQNLLGLASFPSKEGRSVYLFRKLEFEIICLTGIWTLAFVGVTYTLNKIFIFYSKVNPVQGLGVLEVEGYNRRQFVQIGVKVNG